MLNVNSLPEPEQVLQLYSRYYIQDATPEAVMSSHWKQYSSRIQVRIDGRGNLDAFKGRGFGDLESKRKLNRFLNYICNISYFARMPYRKDLIFLARESMPIFSKIDTYFSYDCFRQLCALATIRQRLKFKSHEGFNALVIGDGYGFFSAVLKKVYPNSTVTLIDIGKVLLFQSVNLQRIYPGRPHYLLDGSGGVEEADFIYIPAEHVKKADGIKYSLAVNMSSMQEMTYGMIGDYFCFLRMNLVEDNLFYCCNRQKKELPGGEVIEFLKYPWLKQDRHFIDEAPPFYSYYFCAPYPFVRRFDGPFRHRLTNLKVSREV